MACVLGLVALPSVVHAGFLDLVWSAPTTNADGSPLIDLQGYRVYSDISTPPCPGGNYQALAAPAPNPAPGDTVPATLTNLVPGTPYFIRVSAVDTSGNESACTPAVSGVARTNLDATPATLPFGSVSIGSTPTLDLTVTNVGATPLTGTATTAAPFSIVAGGSVNLAPGASQVVRVRFTPLTAQTFAGSVNVSAGGDSVSRPVSGTGVAATPAVLQFSQATYAVTEGGSVTVTVTRTGGTHGGVTVQYATSNGTATAGADYTAAAGTLTFAANQMSRTFTVATVQNTVPEAPEDVILTLSNAQGGASLGAPSVATLTINDDESTTAVLQFSQANYVVTEGGAATITVTRTGQMQGSVTVQYATGAGTATAGTDYTAASGTLTFAANQASRTFKVTTLPDTVVEGAETIILTLSNPQGGAILGPANPAALTVIDDDAGGAVQFGAATYSVNEGAKSVTVGVTRTGGAASGVTVDYATADGSAVAGSDYEARTGTLTFNAGVKALSIVVPILQDSAVEGPETFTLTLSNPGGGATLGATGTTTVTITDDEPTLRFSKASYTVAETAGEATITVSRIGSTAGAVTVDYATTATGSATAGAGGDFTPVAGTLTFAAGQTSRTFTVPVLDDDVVDGPKTVGLQLTNAAGAVLGTPSTATLTLTDSDVAGTIQFGAARYTADEGAGTYQVPVTRKGGAAAGASATYTLTPGTATLGLDFAASATGTVTFGAGVKVLTIPITVMGDAQLEGPETLDLTLSNPGGGAALGAIRRTTVTIDEMVFQFAPAVFRVAEGSVATITVARTGPASRSATIDWVTGDGTATAGSDYTAGSGTLTFPAGIRTRTFTVTTIADTIVEGAETVLLTLRNPSAGSILATQRTAVLTITDNDAGGRIAFTTASHLVAENWGTYEVAVVRTGGAASSVTVDYAVVGGTATGGSGDYSLADGTVTFAAGQRSAPIRVAIVDDGVVEPDKTVILQLGNPTGGASLGTPSTTTITIRDDDRTATVQFGAAAYTVVEGAGSALITVTRAGSTTAAVSVVLMTSDGTAEAGRDYTAVNTTVVFDAGVKSQTVTVPITPTASVDGTRTVNLALSGATAPAAVGTPATAVLSILDDDSTLAFSTAAYGVTEGGTATIAVWRTGSPLGTVSVDYAVTGGTATAGADFAATSGRLTFGPGVMRRTFSVRTLADAAVEGNQTVQLALSAPAGSATIGVPGSATLTVTDAPPVVKFGAPAYTVTEGVATATITVVRTGPTTGTSTVRYARTGGTASGSDYSVTAGTLTFEPGVKSRTFTVAITNDLVFETPETVVFQLSNAAGAVIGTPGSTTLTIVDNEPQLRFASATYTVSEGTPAVTLTVVRTGTTAVPVAVEYVRVGGTATGNGVDYSFTRGRLSFGPGVTSRTFTVAITKDSVMEGPETVIFGLTEVMGARIGTPSTATLTIVDNAPQVRFAAASYTVSEATSAVTLKVLRTGPTAGTVTVDYAATGGTAVSGQDYTLAAGTLTFGPGVTAQSFTLALINDSVVEGAETIVLTLSNPGGATLGTPAVATVKATSNDVGGLLRFENAVYSREESGGSATITVTRTGGLASGVTVDVATVDGTAVAGTHYAAVAGTLTFGAGQTSASFTVPLLDNGVAEASRWLSLMLSTPGGGATLGTPSSAVLWIVNDD